ncbi:hypothetical protein [Cupriavidus lacunae]|uniref:Uncharacterized protein n=1 Tax=Cupriavidus lacunae TaxID=2666307 RepID=A0A370NKI0_9BURK|nr:hypothetical protein [Cupriavidus lacunae]RDK06087.1 hypothetical protein DN412_33255 [Cupriavidus lacunae]
MIQKFLEIEVGPVSYDEACAQVGTDDYAERSRLECAVYIRQLGRIFGMHASDALTFVRRGFAHDFGCVVARMNAAGAALFDESRLPAQWDHIARAELTWLSLSYRYRRQLQDGEREPQNVPMLYRLGSIPDFPDHPVAHWLALGVVPMPTGPALALH